VDLRETGLFTLLLGQGYVSEVERDHGPYLKSLSTFDISDTVLGGLQEVPSDGFLRPPGAIRGQLEGPISFGLNVHDQDGRPILFDDTVRPFMLEFMAKRVNVQLARLKALNPQCVHVHRRAWAAVSVQRHGRIRRPGCEARHGGLFLYDPEAPAACTCAAIRTGTFSAGPGSGSS